MKIFPVLLLVCAPGWGVVAAQQPLTVAERSEFRATSTYEETLDFLESLTSTSRAMSVESYGRSAQGRELPLLIASSDEAFTPEEARETGKPVVLIQSGIHPGEIDGKDASLMLLRALADGEHPEILDKLILLVVPIYNVDGHERVSPYNRPNQDGPVEGMGFRTTADGHDLNRDHLKLETPEAQAAIALFNAWRPHLHVDNHVTNGSDHEWVLTYSWAESPQLSPVVGSWLERHMPRAIAATERSGHKVGPYISLVDRGDPGAGIDSTVIEPRYATGYYPLRNRPSILVENHSYKPYRERVLANHDFMLALLQEIATAPERLVESVERAEQRTIAAGRPDAQPSRVTLTYARGGSEMIRSPLYDWYEVSSVVSGQPLLRFRRGEVREIEIPWYHRLRPEHVVMRPRGYLILPGWPAIERRLLGHGLHVQRLDAAIEREVETFRIRDKAPRPRSYQGLTRLDLEVTRDRENRRFPEGTLWVPADQPDFEIAVQLLEPEAHDSLAAWGLLSTVIEQKEYIGSAVLEDLASAMLEDAAVAEAWERALENEAFAADRTARYLWWYKRTPYWDESVGLMPVMRLMTPADFPLAAWPE